MYGAETRSLNALDEKNVCDIGEENVPGLVREITKAVIEQNPSEKDHWKGPDTRLEDSVQKLINIVNMYFLNAIRQK